jgi:Transposase, Mutator family
LPETQLLELGLILLLSLPPRFIDVNKNDRRHSGFAEFVCGIEEFEDEWGKRYPAIGQAWRSAWEHVVPFFAFAPGVRKMIYTTNRSRR